MTRRVTAREQLFEPSAAVTHATVDLVAFLTCYVSLCTRSQADKDTLAAKSFKVTDALRATRANFDAAPAANGAA